MSPQSADLFTSVVCQSCRKQDVAETEDEETKKEASRGWWERRENLVVLDPISASSGLSFRSSCFSFRRSFRSSFLSLILTSLHRPDSLLFFYIAYILYWFYHWVVGASLCSVNSCLRSVTESVNTRMALHSAHSPFPFSLPYDFLGRWFKSSKSHHVICFVWRQWEERGRRGLHQRTEMMIIRPEGKRGKRNQPSLVCSDLFYSLSYSFHFRLLTVSVCLSRAHNPTLSSSSDIIQLASSSFLHVGIRTNRFLVFTTFSCS